MEREEVFNKYKAVMSHSTIPELKKYKEGYIFDENMSVKWNREQVQLRNEEYKDEAIRLRKEHVSLENEADDAAVEYLLGYSSTIKNRNAMSSLLGFALEHRHSEGYESVFNFAEELVDLIDEMNG